MKALAWNHTSKFAAAALALVVQFAAAPATASAAAEVLKLDCSVSVDTYNVSEARDGRDSGSSWGVWKIRVEDFSDIDLPSEVSLTQSTPFGVPYWQAGLDMDYLEGYDDAPTVSPDPIEWCPDRRGCGVQIPFLKENGWYKVGRAVVDRRRGTFNVKVEIYWRQAGTRMVHDYYGACAPEPGRQF